MRTLRAAVGLLVASLVVLAVAGAAVTGAGRAAVAAAQRDLDQQVLPARQTATDLATAYVDQESGQRGYLLTGDPEFLEPYERGRTATLELQRRLADLLDDDAAGSGLVAAVRSAGSSWHDETAEPGIAARRQGPLTPAELDAVTREGKVRFDALRAQLAALQAHTAVLTADQLRAIGRAQTAANAVAVLAAVLALAVAVAVVPLGRRLLTRPLDRLLDDVRAVAAGDHDRTIAAGGPRELASIAEAVDRMRAAVVAHSRDRAAVEHELALRQEHDRMAADLHDLTIQRVFGVGLRLTALARRHPEVAGAVRPLVQQTDRIIGELRTVIFNLSRSESGDTLRARVIDVADESARVLGFTPSLEFSGAVDTLASDTAGAEVLAALREALSNTARHASATAAAISLATRDGSLSLTVTDNGVGVRPDAPAGNGLANLRARAERLGGTVDIGPGPDGSGTTVRWRIPAGAP
ncbi:CHASE3 domain-containing protein [Geodermatophilus sp. CPCC 206100]|uniref:CHASE3 domain-containing protein n=1 Tax=Geodermatophilus sp. CPCC 206100 TaxID=3020054 RepID=UPI003B001B9C